MAQDYYTVLTNAGLAYETKSKAQKTPINLSYLAVGDGNGEAYRPGPEATALRRETHRQELNALLQDDNNPTWLMAEALLPDDVGGWTIREVGIYTDTGILYAIGRYPESIKPLLPGGATKQFYVKAIFQTSNAANVTLIVDNNTVQATRDFVINHVRAELDKLDAKNSVLVATTEHIELNGLQPVDGEALHEGDRVLVKNQEQGKDNGPYVAATGDWKRARDADHNNEVTPGLFVHVEKGVKNGDSIWQLVTDAPIVLGTTDLRFEVVAGRTGVAGGTYRSVTVDKLGRVIAGTNPTTAVGYGLAEDLAWPLAMLPLPSVLTDDTRVPVTTTIAPSDGGQVSTPKGVVISLGEEIVPGRFGRPRTFTTAPWISPLLVGGAEFFLRAQVVTGKLKLYVQQGTLYDPVPASMKGTPNGASGGGFPTTALDVCIARVITRAAGTLPTVQSMYIGARTTWTQSLNGTGVVYLPFDPHVRAARLTTANPNPAIGVISQVNFDSLGWTGSNYIVMAPGPGFISSWDGWATPGSGVQVMTNNYPNDATVTTVSACFDHSVGRSLWQSYQAEHKLDDPTAASDELLFSMGIKNHLQSEYDLGIAVNFSNAVNIPLAWEVMR